MEEITSLMKGTWVCPYCRKTRTLIHIAPVVTTATRGSLSSHVRYHDDTDHGPHGQHPPDFHKNRITENVSISPCVR